MKHHKYVIDQFISESDSIIIEGVRHKTILKEINNLADHVISVFVEADQKTRYERCINRKKYSDEVKSYQYFQILDNHSVELEIESLKTLCDIIIDSTEDYSNEIVMFISSKLKE